MPDNELFREFDKLIPAAVWIMHGSIRLAQQGFEQLCKPLSARLTGVGLTPATLSLRSLWLAIVCTHDFMERGLHLALPDAAPKLSGEVTGQPKIRLFPDSNVLTGGKLFRPGGSRKRRFGFVRPGSYRLVLAEMVRDKVEENLLVHAQRLPALNTDQLIED